MEDIRWEKQDVNRLLANQKDYFNSGETKNITFRIKQLKKLKNIIKINEIAIKEALYKDLGKSSFESYATEIGYVLKEISIFIKKLKAYSSIERKRTPIYLKPGKSMIIKEPYGNVLVMVPYNYPFQLAMEPLIGAIAAGNCCIVKLPDTTLNTSKLICDLINDNFKTRYIFGIIGGNETGALLSEADFDYIFYTGGAEGAKKVLSAAAKKLIPCTLELGGKSPVIVDETANIRKAAQRILWGKIVNAGQTCVAPDYVLVHESVRVKFFNELKRSVEVFFAGNIRNSKGYGRIVNGEHFKRLVNIIEAERDNIVFGGGYDERDLYIEPTVLQASSRLSTSMKEEIFGPVLPVLTYSDLRDAIYFINQGDKPLALYLFTRNRSVEKQVMKEVSFGGGCINDTLLHLANPNLPFGGVGNSGMGAYHGKYSFETFTHRKSVLKKSNFGITMMYPPYRKINERILRLLFK